MNKWRARATVGKARMPRQLHWGRRGMHSQGHSILLRAESTPPVLARQRVSNMPSKPTRTRIHFPAGTTPVPRQPSCQNRGFGSVSMELACMTCPSRATAKSNAAWKTCFRKHRAVMARRDSIMGGAKLPEAFAQREKGSPTSEPEDGQPLDTFHPTTETARPVTHDTTPRSPVVEWVRQLNSTSQELIHPSEGRDRPQEAGDPDGSKPTEYLVLTQPIDGHNEGAQHVGR